MWCWWCCHAFEGEALHLPYKHDVLRNRFETMGAFCSWGCMKAFNLDRNGVNRGGIIGQNILMMRKQVCGVLTSIKCAPNRFALKEFGGEMTVEEFRAIGTGKDHVTVHMPDEFLRYQIVKRDKYEARGSTVKELDGKFQEIAWAPGTNETLKLKRPQPLKRDANNLETSLGITRKAA
jgi:hypothetical protein